MNATKLTRIGAIGRQRFLAASSLVVVTYLSPYWSGSVLAQPFHSGLIESNLAYDLADSAVPILQADFNLDGRVDESDLNVWQLNFGAKDANREMGDATDDGVVTGADFLVWQQEFGVGYSEETLKADFNSDNIVNHVDASVWEQNFGVAAATHAMGDADLNGVVDGADFVILQREHGSMALELTMAADFDLDGAVNAVDLGTWQQHFGTTGATHSMGDADLDGIVAGSDFLIWQREYGADLTVNGSGIPESTSFTLLVIGLTLGLLIPRRLRHRM